MPRHGAAAGNPTGKVRVVKKHKMWDFDCTMSERCGQLLIATSPLKDPNFHRTIVLIVRDDENGTFGLVLNRPLETTVKDACASAMSFECDVDAPLHFGGPCLGLLTVIHPQPELG